MTSGTSDGSVTAAIGQFAPTQDVDENLTTVTALIAAAASRGADLLVLPEYALFTAPRTDERLVAAAQPLTGPFVLGAQAAAAEHRIAVVFGTAEPAGPGRVHNTLVAVDAAGAIVATYRKLHLYDAFGAHESAVIQPGTIEPPQTFTLGGLRFGLQTCYDLRFPEVSRRLVDAGAEVIVTPAQWVPGPLKEEHWELLARARAVENTVYLLGAGQTAGTGVGRSLVVDPMGVVVAALGERPGLTTAELDPARVAQVREVNPALELRRFTVVPSER